MKIEIINNVVHFIPENDLDIYRLGSIKFYESNIEFTSENKLTSFKVKKETLIKKLFESENNLYNN